MPILKVFIKWIKRLLIRVGFLLINVILRPWLLKWLGVERLFIVYPENEEFANAFTFKWMRDRYMKQTPWIGGIYRQNGKWGVMAVVYVLPHEFNENRLTIIYRNAVILQRKIRAKSISCAGIMPSRMKLFGIRNSTIETEVTAISVVKAVKQLREDHLVIILGGKGHTGKFVERELCENGIPTVIIDLPRNGSKINHEEWCALNSSSFILINLISGKDLRNYFPFLKKGDLVLNEAYPAPGKEIVEKMKEIGIKGFHIVGVKPTFCFPFFPGEYRGGVPCRGMLPGDSPILLKNL